MSQLWEERERLSQWLILPCPWLRDQLGQARGPGPASPVLRFGLGLAERLEGWQMPVPAGAFR